MVAWSNLQATSGQLWTVLQMANAALWVAQGRPLKDREHYGSQWIEQKRTSRPAYLQVSHSGRIQGSVAWFSGLPGTLHCAKTDKTLSSGRRPPVSHARKYSSTSLLQCGLESESSMADGHGSQRHHRRQAVGSTCNAAVPS